MGQSDGYGYLTTAFIQAMGQMTATLFRAASFAVPGSWASDIWQQLTSGYPTVTFESDRFIRIKNVNNNNEGFITPYYVLPVLPYRTAEGTLKVSFDIRVHDGGSPFGVCAGKTGIGFVCVPEHTGSTQLQCKTAVFFDFNSYKMYVVVTSDDQAYCQYTVADSGTIDVIYTSRAITNFDPTKRNTIEFRMATSQGTYSGLRIALVINGVLVDQTTVISDEDLAISDGIHPYLFNQVTGDCIDLFSVMMSR